MKYINVTTPDNIEVEYRLAGAGSRIAAAAIDTGIQVLLMLIVTLIGFLLIFDLNSLTLELSYRYIGWVSSVLIITYFIIYFGYFLICEMLMKGRTVGKAIFKLRTVKNNGQPVTFIQSIVRNILRVIIDNYGVGILMMMFHKKYKRLGDLLAGTMVVSENPDIIRSETLIRPEVALGSQNLLNTRYPLSGREYELLKEYFSKKESMLDKGLSVRHSLLQYFSQKYALDLNAIDEIFLAQLLSENAKQYT